MNAHALGILEFPRLLDVVAGLPRPRPGRRAFARWCRRADIAWLEARASCASPQCARCSVAICRGSPEPVPDLEGSLQRLRVVGHRVDGARAARAARRCFARRAAPATRCATSAARRSCAPCSALRRAHGRRAERRRSRSSAQLVEDGIVRDEASPALRRIRRELRASQGELCEFSSGSWASLDPHHRVAGHVGHGAQRALRDSRSTRGRAARRRHRARRVGDRRHAVRRAAGRGRVRQPDSRARGGGAARRSSAFCAS